MTKHNPQAVLDYIISFKKDNDGLSPSIREIGEACQIPSTSNVTDILKKLEQDGSITRQGKRGIEVRGGHWVWTGWI